MAREVVRARSTGCWYQLKKHTGLRKEVVMIPMDGQRLQEVVEDWHKDPA